MTRHTSYVKRGPPTRVDLIYLRLLLEKVLCNVKRAGERSPMQGSPAILWDAK